MHHLWLLASQIKFELPSVKHSIIENDWCCHRSYQYCLARAQVVWRLRLQIHLNLPGCKRIVAIVCFTLSSPSVSPHCQRKRWTQSAPSELSPSARPPCQLPSRNLPCLHWRLRCSSVVQRQGIAEGRSYSIFIFQQLVPPCLAQKVETPAGSRRISGNQVQLHPTWVCGQVQLEVAQETLDLCVSDRHHQAKKIQSQDRHLATTRKIHRSGEQSQGRITLQVSPWNGGKPNCRACMAVEKGLLRSADSAHCRHSETWCKQRKAGMGIYHINVPPKLVIATSDLLTI